MICAYNCKPHRHRSYVKVNVHKNIIWMSISKISNHIFLDRYRLKYNNIAHTNWIYYLSSVAVKIKHMRKIQSDHVCPDPACFSYRSTNYYRCIIERNSNKISKKKNLFNVVYFYYYRVGHQHLYTCIIFYCTCYTVVSD